jgi:hypothetical protein
MQAIMASQLPIIGEVGRLTDSVGRLNGMGEQTTMGLP